MLPNAESPAPSLSIPFLSNQQKSLSSLLTVGSGTSKQVGVPRTQVEKCKRFCSEDSPHRDTSISMAYPGYKSPSLPSVTQLECGQSVKCAISKQPGRSHSLEAEHQVKLQGELTGMTALLMLPSQVTCCLSVRSMISNIYTS